MAVGGEDSAILKRVVNADEQDITSLYENFCKANGYDLSKKSHIENAAVPFIKKHEMMLP